MDQLVEFNQDLVAELREECAVTDLPLEDVAFERLCETLEAEGEIRHPIVVPIVAASPEKRFG